jgi:hypothetical protein
MTRAIGASTILVVRRSARTIASSGKQIRPRVGYALRLAESLADAKAQDEDDDAHENLRRTT